MEISEYPNVLIAAPTYQNKHRCVGEWMANTRHHTWPRFDMYLVDNSPNESYHKELSQLYGIEVDYIDPKGKKTAQILGESYQKIQEKFHAGNYDYLLIKEIDIRVPRQAIELLYYQSKPVVSIPYFTGQGKDAFMLAWYIVTQADGTVTNKLLKHEECFSIWDGKPHITYENGIGCTLISKEVLEKIKFRWEADSIGFTDSIFYRDLFKAEILNYMLTSVIAGHDNDDWSRVYANQK